jgi:hypothetical protein
MGLTMINMPGDLGPSGALCEARTRLISISELSRFNVKCSVSLRFPKTALAAIAPDVGFTGFPATAVITSPTSRPARAAGD